eukprot:ANDGO_00204.mRNA.1 Origin of replication complex subunit 4
MSGTTFEPKAIFEAVRLLSADAPSLNPSKSLYAKIRKHGLLSESVFSDAWFQSFFAKLRSSYSDFASAESDVLKKNVSSIAEDYCQNGASSTDKKRPAIEGVASPSQKRTKGADPLHAATASIDDSSSSAIPHFREVLRRHLSSSDYVPAKLGPVLDTALSELRDSLVNCEHAAYMLTGPSGCGKHLLLKSVLANVQYDMVIHLCGKLFAEDKRLVTFLLKKLGYKYEDLMYASLDVLCDMLRIELQRRQTEKSGRVILIISPLDTFAETCPRSLYTIFDFLHLSSSPQTITVITLSNRTDADALLEKRARSRFVFRHFGIRLFRNAEELTSVCKLVLSLSPAERDVLIKEKRVLSSIVNRFQLQVDHLFKRPEFIRILDLIVTKGMNMHHVCRFLDTIVANFPEFDSCFAAFESMNSLSEAAVSTLTQLEIGVLFALSLQEEYAAPVSQIESLVRERFGAGMISSKLLKQALLRCFYLGFCDLSEDESIARLAERLTMVGNPSEEIKLWISKYPNCHTALTTWGR